MSFDVIYETKLALAPGATLILLRQALIFSRQSIYDGYIKVLLVKNDFS
jgi:hypothetical protein